MLVTRQNQLDQWFEKAANNPHTRRWLSPRAHMTPPTIEENTWAVMHFLVGDALVTLRLDRALMEASIVMYNSGTIVEGAAALDEAYQIGYKSGPWRALRSACCVTNERSMKLNRKVFGEPWGISEKSAWDAGLAEWVDEAHFRRLRAEGNGDMPPQ
jgi:hypothetical protein